MSYKIQKVYNTQVVKQKRPYYNKPLTEHERYINCTWQVVKELKFSCYTDIKLLVDCIDGC